MLTPLIAIAAATFAAAPTAKTQSQSAETLDSDAIRSRRTAAAAWKGVRWMVTSAERMPRGWVYPFFTRLHRVVTDDDLTAAIETVLGWDMVSGDHVVIPSDLSDPKHLEPKALSPILFELLRRKQLGLPYEDAARTLGKKIAEREPGIWKHMRVIQRATYMYLLPELGIETNLRLENITNGLRQSAERQDAETLAKNSHYVYGLTHLILARSRYYRVFVDRAEFEFAVPILLAALKEQLKQRNNVQKFDMIGSVLSALALMRVLDDDRIAAARAELVARQNYNGSWGTRVGAGKAKTHATLNGVLGTIQYPETFRVQHLESTDDDPAPSEPKGA
jgi:hypothetical protein